MGSGRLSGPAQERPHAQVLRARWARSGCPSPFSGTLKPFLGETQLSPSAGRVSPHQAPGLDLPRIFPEGLIRGGRGPASQAPICTDAGDLRSALRPHTARRPPLGARSGPHDVRLMRRRRSPRGARLGATLAGLSPQGAAGRGDSGMREGSSVPRHCVLIGRRLRRPEGVAGQSSRGRRRGRGRPRRAQICPRAAGLLPRAPPRTRGGDLTPTCPCSLLSLLYLTQGRSPPRRFPPCGFCPRSPSLLPVKLTHEFRIPA